MNRPGKSWWPTALRGLLGVLLLWAAVSKLANLTDFLASLYAYKLPLPRTFLQLVAVMLPWVELLCGLALLGNVWTESVLVLAAGLFAVFVLATGQAWARGLDISCGCFSLKTIGLETPTDGGVPFYESAPFAFFRALMLTMLAGFLLRRRLISDVLPTNLQTRSQRT